MARLGDCCPARSYRSYKLGSGGEFRMRKLIRTGLQAMLCVTAVCAVAAAGSPQVKVSRFVDGTSVELTSGQQNHVLHVGEHMGDWTLMEVVRNPAGSHP